MPRHLLAFWSFVLTLLIAARPAGAHSVGQINTSIYFDPPTQSLILARGMSAMPGIRMGDTLGYIVEFTPVANGATVGAGGYVTTYLPSGLEVIGAEFVAPDGFGGFVQTTPQLPGPMSDGWGNRGEGSYTGFTTLNATYAARCLAAMKTPANCSQRMAQIYADTGIFYSTDPRTALFVQPSMDGIARQGTNGYNINPTGAGQLNPILNQAAATTHNLWDAAQTNAFGSTANAVNALANPKSAAPAVGDGRGTAPYMAGSAVAGADVASPLDNTGATGPWLRIAAPGSRIGNLMDTPATNADGSSPTFVAGSYTAAGRAVSAAAPLPAGTNAIRWAVGRLVVGTLRYVRLTVRVTAPPPGSGFLVNSEVFGGDSATAAGERGQDNSWRYHVPSVAAANSQVLLSHTLISVNGQPASGSLVPANARLRYRITYANLANVPLANVQLAVTLPPRLAGGCPMAGPVSNVMIVSGPNVLPYTPACPTSGQTMSFALLRSLGTGEAGVIEYDVQLAAGNGDVLISAATLAATGLSPTARSTAIVTVGDQANLLVSITANPSTIMPAATTTYTITIINSGTRPASTITVNSLLGTSGGAGATRRFDFVAGSSVIAGLPAAVPVVAAPPTLVPYTLENRQQLTWSFGAATLAPGARATIQYTARAGAAMPESPPTYPSDVVVGFNDGNNTTETTVVAGAPVTIRSLQLAITAPMNGSTTMNNRPAITGTTAPGATVTVSIDGGAPIMTMADAMGNWSVTPPAPLMNGMHSVVATARDGGGNMAMANTMFTVMAPLPTLTITAPANGSVTSNNRPAITGRADPGAMVQISIDGGPPVVVVADAMGNWSYTPPVGLIDGPHTVVARTTDGAGNTVSATTMFTVDSTPPAITITSPANGSVTAVNQPPIVGRTEPNLVVTVVIDGGAPLMVTADAMGNWSVTPPAPLMNGMHTAVATARDAAGNMASARTTFTINSAAPVLSITAPANGSSTNNNRPAITGRANPNATVTVSIDGGPPVTVMADAMGNWMLTPAMPLADGPHTVVARTMDLAGNMAMATTTFTVDTAVPTITIVSPADGSTTANRTPTITGRTEPNAIVTVSIDGGPPQMVMADAMGNWAVMVMGALADGVHMVSAVARDAAGNMASAMSSFTVSAMAPTLTISSPPAGSSTNNNRPAITGRAAPGAMVQVSIDGGPPVTVIADAMGNWSYTPAIPLADGPHNVNAETMDAMGNRAMASTNFNVDTVVPTIVITSPPDGSTIRDVQPVIMGRTEPNATVIVVIDGGAPIMTMADAMGNWSVTPPAPLVAGMHRVMATARDAAGNMANTMSTFTIDLGAALITITTPPNGSATNNRQPPIMGMALPGAMVQVSIDGGPPVTVIADAMGNWSYTPPMPLSEGPHMVVATTTNAGGMMGRATTNFVVDVTAPTIRITNPPNGATIADRTPPIQGNTEPNAFVTLVIDGGAPIMLMADAMGNWTYTPLVPLMDGMHTLVATARDAAGNTATTMSGFTVRSMCRSNADCNGTAPICDVPMGICRGCAADPECGGTTPACQPNGSCGECSITNATLCMGATPVCDVRIARCVARPECMTDPDCPAMLPVCSAMQRCVLCTPGPMGNANACRMDPAGGACVLPMGSTIGVCGCTMDSDCPNTHVCNVAAQRCEPRSLMDGGVNDGAIADTGVADATATDGSARADGSRDGGMDGSRNDGVVSGGGACACRAAGAVPSRDSTHQRTMLLIGALGAVLASRRRNRGNTATAPRV